MPGIGEFREARAGDEVGTRHQILDRLAHGACAQQQRLALAARVKQPLSKDVATLGVGGELDFVDSKEVHLDVTRHGFDCANPEPRRLGLDFFFAGDQRHRLNADFGHHAVIDLAGQQPQRQADHARLVRNHAFDGEMRLAGVRWPENRRNVAGLQRLNGIAVADGHADLILKRGSCAEEVRRACPECRVSVRFRSSGCLRQGLANVRCQRRCRSGWLSP